MAQSRGEATEVAKPTVGVHIPKKKPRLGPRAPPPMDFNQLLKVIMLYGIILLSKLLLIQ